MQIALQKLREENEELRKRIKELEAIPHGNKHEAGIPPIEEIAEASEDDDLDP
jgi:BMFP domain-containing protein YqiC